jgi:hypothetical protein
MVAQLKTQAKPIPFVREFPILGSIPQFMGDRLAFQLRIVQEPGGCLWLPFGASAHHCVQ